MSNIIDLSAARAAASVRTKSAPSNPSFEPPTADDLADFNPGAIRRHRILKSPEPETETGKNARLRLERREPWWMAERQVEYYKACMKMHDAISSVQRAGLPEGANHKKAEHEQRWVLVDGYREAIGRLFLTPACRLSDVTWKQKALAAGQHKHTELSAKRIEHAIAQDIAFFAAHPVRRHRGEQSA